MDFGQIRQQQQEGARQMTYQNSGYQFERRTKKTLILDITDTASVAPLSTASDFSIKLFEPLLVDKLSDVYIDSIATFNCLLSDINNRSAFSLKIKEFNVNSNVASSNSTSQQQLFNNILVPNEHNDVNDVYSVVMHKGKKMNYVCSINPGKITHISGKISDLAGNSIFSTSNSNGDGGKLHYVKLGSVITGTVDAGTAITFAGGTSGSGGFVTAFFMQSNTDDLYFYSAGSTVDTPASLGAITSSGTPLNTKNTDTNYYREGDHPRIIVEFVIASR